MSKDSLGSDRKARLLEILRRAYPVTERQVPHDVSDFMYEFGSVSGALLYAALFVPNFCVVDGSVLLDDGTSDFPNQFIEAKSKATMKFEELEASFNWREVPYLFLHGEEGDKECEVLAEFIAEAWRTRLKVLFPQREFTVRILPPDETGGWIGVGFRERRRPLS